MIDRRALIAAPALLLPNHSWADWALPDNKMVYPGNSRAPGFDISHPASNQPIISAIAASGNVLNVLLKGSVGTISGTGTITASIDETMGPVTNYSSNGGSQVSTYGTSVNPRVINAYTMASIFSRTGALTSAARAMGWLAAGGLGASVLGINTSNNFEFTSLSAANDIGVANVLNAPYFFGISVPGNLAIGATPTCNWVVTRLDKGQIFSGTKVSSATANVATPSTTANVMFGNTSVASPAASLTGSLAAGMVSSVFLTLGQLQAWAADPWAYWYPYTNPDAIAVGGKW